MALSIGSLGCVKDWLEAQFDHTMLLDLMTSSRKTSGDLSLSSMSTVVYDDVIRTARYVFNWVDSWIREETDGRAWLSPLKCENDKNSAMIVQTLGRECSRLLSPN